MTETAPKPTGPEVIADMSEVHVRIALRILDDVGPSAVAAPAVLEEFDQLDTTSRETAMVLIKDGRSLDTAVPMAKAL